MERYWRTSREWMLVDLAALVGIAVALTLDTALLAWVCVAALLVSFAVTVHAYRRRRKEQS